MIFRKSITAKFIVLVFLVLFIAQSIGTVAFLLYIRSSFLEEIRTRMKMSAAIVAGVSAYPLLSYDYSLIDTYLEEVAKDEGITSIHIFDSKGKVVREKIKAEAADISSANPLHIRKSMTEKVQVKSGGAGIGEIVINYTGKSVNDRINKSIILISVYQGIALALIGFVVIYFFNRNIKRPVVKINAAIGKITTGDMTVAVPDLGDDEIGGIAKGVAFLEERLSTVIVKLNSTTVNVAMAIQQVDSTYKNVTGGITTQSDEVKDVIRSIQNAAKSQAEISDGTEKLSGFSAENVSSLLEMKETSEEIAFNVQRLFKATEDSYSVVVQMNQVAKAIAENAGRTFSAVEDTSASVEEVGASIRGVEEHANESSKLAEKVREITSGVGMPSVVDAIEGMGNISEEVRKSAEIIQRLGVRSGDIEKVLSVIKDVTEQTNLLSLNAAILAAQAGEYGKSFSVVADEIRGLSERTSISTREIGGIVKNIQNEIKEAVYTIDSAQGKVEEGNSLVVKVGDALRDILNAAGQSAEMTKAIERATEEQSLGLRQITLAIEEIRKMMNSVVKSTKEQDNALGYLLEGAGEVKEVAELSKRGAFEQAEGTKLISRNLALANDRINHINEAVLNQQKLNSSIMDAMDKISKIGGATVRDMGDVSTSLKTLTREMDTLRQDMGIFKVK